VAIDQSTAAPADAHAPGLIQSWSVVQSSLVLLALLWWGTGLVWGTGGRDPHVLSVGLLLVCVAAVATRPWERLRPLSLAMSLVPGAAAFLICLVSPTGWAGADVAASWAYTGLLCGLVAAWAVDARRRYILCLALVIAPLGTFAKGWLAWWAGQDPSRPFIGTFYWHNQEAAFLLIGAVSALGLILNSNRSARALGWLAVGLCGAGVVLTTSRATMFCLVVCLVLVLLACASRRAWRQVLQVAAASGVIFALATLLTGPPFFAHRGGALAGTAARSQAGESLGANGGHRLDDWAAAIRVTKHWPLTGTGFHGFASGSALPAAGGQGSNTPFAHNGFLQAFVDGGVPLGVVVCAVVGIVLLAATRQAVRARLASDWATLSAAAALLGATFHSAVDFDWTYPALLAGSGLVAVLASGPVRAASLNRRTWGGVVWVGLGLLATVAAWKGGLTLNVPIGSAT
jgi:O-antigen ligase